MSKVLVEESSLSGIAGAIRQKNGTNSTYKPSQMAAAIQALPGASTLGTKNIVTNGNYAASGDNLDGYSSVSVNVPNSYAAADEGKVVSNGALVAQTARSSAITQNGTYDTTTNDEVTVNVSGGGGAKNILSGTSGPQPNWGEDGSVYLKYYSQGQSLPSGYSQVTYIKSALNKYIDTGFKPKGTTRVVMDVFSSSANAMWFGCWNTNYNHGAFAVTNDITGIYAGYSNNGGTTGAVLDVLRHTVEMDKGTVRFDGDVFRAFAFDSAYQATVNLYLFAQNRAGSLPSSTGSREICCVSCKIYDNDVLVRDYVPAVRDSDGIAGMYDLVNNAFSTSGASGDFEAGDTIADNEIIIAYLKVDGAWVNLIGQDIDDVNLGGE